MLLDLQSLKLTDQTCFSCFLCDFGSAETVFCAANLSGVILSYRMYMFFTPPPRDMRVFFEGILTQQCFGVLCSQGRPYFWNSVALV